ncbi:MAG: MBL fold metallo-hydrolase RNA specificity domain-containing protein, partial [Desulfotomaculales bacterium]
SGDLGRENKPYLNDPAPLAGADFLVLEATYGDRLHEEGESRPEDRRELLREIIWSTYRKGGNLVIPAFAVERTQDLIYDLNLLVARGDFPPVKIYIDSPLATATTEIFRRHARVFDQETKDLIASGKDPFNLPMLEFTRTTEESMALNRISGGAIIISASGMAEAGRIKHHLKHNLWRPECTVLLVGYMAPGTKGRQLKDGAKKVCIHGEEIAVRAEIKSIEGYSSHADKNDLLAWVEKMSRLPRRAFLVHGEKEACSALAGELGRKLGIDAYVPAPGEAVELTAHRVVGEEEIRAALADLSARLEEVLRERTAEDSYPGILARLGELAGIVEKIKSRSTA